MLLAHDKVPDYLLGKVQLISTVVFTALFSVFFFIGVVPSSNLLWPQLDSSQLYYFSLLTYGVALLIVIKEELNEREIDRNRLDPAKARVADSRHLMYRRLSRARATSAEAIRTRTEGLRRTLSTKKKI